MDANKAFQIKNKRIDKAIGDKGRSIKVSAAFRDSALFTASRLGTWKEASQKTFIEEHAYWLDYFKKLYFPTNEEGIKEVEREAYKQDSLNSL